MIRGDASATITGRFETEIHIVYLHIVQYHSDAKLGFVLAFLAENASGLTVMQQLFTHSRSLLRLCSNFFA
ncbi:unnamed protein product [Calypogeia fissa]